MDNIFSQPKLIYKVSFNTFYKYVDFFERFFPEDVLGISSFELESKTIEAQANDIWHFEVYLSDKPFEQIYTKNLQEFAHQNNLEVIGNIDFATIEDKDWVAEYQRQLVPISVGQFFISSADQSGLCPVDSIPIILEASRAFGTGDHATTSGCLEALESLSGCNFATIYDIGTGSGVLSFASSKLWPKAKVLACDIEEISVEVAKFNQGFNGSKVHFYQNTPESLKIPNGYDKFDLVISNILAKPLIELAQAIKNLLNQDGRVILSGFLDYQMKDMIDAYAKVGLKCEKIIERKTWIVLVLNIRHPG
jgi:ribosomal protein L11 methyltransferase